MGGTFGARSKNYETSMKIGGPVFDEILKATPDLVVTDCLGCKLQIQHGTSIKTTHPILILKQAYGL